MSSIQCSISISYYNDKNVGTSVSQMFVLYMRNEIKGGRFLLQRENRRERTDVGEILKCCAIKEPLV